jgi:hypothetical protein
MSLWEQRTAPHVVVLKPSTLAKFRAQSVDESNIGEDIADKSAAIRV